MPRGGKRGGSNRGNSNRGGRGFSLADEARNTGEANHSWDSSRQLRHNKVNFVSAGTLVNPNAKAQEAESAMAHMNLGSPPQHAQDDDGESKVKVEIETEYEGRPTENMSTLEFIIDTHGDDSLTTNLPPPRVRSPSPALSNSSEEIILFGGRNQMGQAIPRSTQGSERASSVNPFDAKIKVVEDQIHVREELLEETLHSTTNLVYASEENMTKHLGPNAFSNEFESVLQGGKDSSRGKRSWRQQKAAKEDAMFADYLANMDSEDKELLASASGLNSRELGETDEDAWQETEISSGEPRISKSRLKNGWDSNIEDLDDLSTSDGVMGVVQGIFSKRQRTSGIQYLVVWEDQSMDEARWVPVTTLTSESAQTHIGLFEAEEQLVAQFAATSADEDDDSTDEEITVTDDEEAEDEADLWQRKVERMDDEQIARLLAKQEELGMGSAELLLFDDAGDADEENDFAAPRGHLNPFMLPSHKRSSKRSTGQFPAATALADAYDGFDVMDFERPSLKKKPKGRKGKLILDDVDDSELEESMQAAWNNDRLKKKERKQEREELRAQGLLGNKNGKADLKQKYKEGMGIGEIKDEIKTFLIGSNSTLALPPMDKSYRKIVHDIANAFQLNSKSVGTGNDRRPILVRTASTTDFIERIWIAVDHRTKRYLPRSDVGRNKWAKTGTTGKAARSGGGGSGNAAASYRDGDVVGAFAPELGAGNRGRAMLEKMGWSQGTGLGALNNKGILQPVSHTVKTTKAGLG